MRLRIIFALAVVCGFSFTNNLRAQQNTKITSSNIGYLEYLPQDYAKNTNKYPIVIFLHGIGERGTTSTDPTTLKNSVQKVANVGLPKYVKYGAQYPFILISPQLKSSYGKWPSSYVMDVLNHVKKYLRVDESRIYITGLSLGGYGTWTTLGDYPEVFAAAVPICSGGSALTKACVIAAENIPLWAFHGTSDNVVSYTVTTKMINAVNACTPKPNPLAKTTLFSGMGHNVWDKTYKETNAINWMISFRNGSSGSTSNNPPTVSAGPDKTITLPTNVVYLDGSASDSDGSIASYRWTKIAGGMASLSGTSTAKLKAYNLLAGTYTFRLTVTDNGGASKYDDVKVTVASTTNIAPIANAGPDKITSSSSITLYGSGSDKDGKIVSYKWIKYYGADVTLTNASTPAVTVSGLKDGNYFLRLTVTDDRGATHYDNMKVTVKGSTAATEPSSSNISPVANAGPDRTTSSSTIKLYGSGSDKDGTIVSYKWTKYYGGSVTLTNANSPTVTVSGMQNGNYFLRLTVTDDRGATHYDNMKVSVSGLSTADASQTTANIPPVAYAGIDRTTSSSSITLTGSGTDKDGSITSYKWIQYGGVIARLTNASTPNVTVSGLIEGSYYLRLTVTDDRGASDSDNVLVKVIKSSSTSGTETTYNLAPVAYAGPNKRITSDHETVRIFGSGKDEDGEIVSYQWTQYGGPDATLINRESSTVTATDLHEGKYYLKLTVQDDDGALHHDQMLLVVDES